MAGELAEAGIDGDQANVLLQMAQIRTSDPAEIRDRLTGLGVGGELLEEGLRELTELLDTANKRMPGAVVADLKIARGLDYYTGSVYESEIEGTRTWVRSARVAATIRLQRTVSARIRVLACRLASRGSCLE